MKSLIIALVFTLSNLAPVMAGDKWSGPTSPIDPMWGMSGSSIMAEGLRDRDSKIDPAFDMSGDSKSKRIRELESELDELKARKSGSREPFSLWDD